MNNYPVYESKEKNLFIYYYANSGQWFIGAEIGGGSSYMKFNSFPESEDVYTLRVIEFTDEDDEDEDDDR